jgi:hypothetical protein
MGTERLVPLISPMTEPNARSHGFPDCRNDARARD